jgi:hypothetical protein
MALVFSLIRLLIILENKFYAFIQSLTDYTNRREVSVIPILPVFSANDFVKLLKLLCIT